MPCSKDITFQSSTPDARYLSQQFFATGSGTLDGFNTITGSESGSFSFDVPTFITSTQIRLTLIPAVRMPLTLENLGATGGNHLLPSSDPSWPYTPCWAGTYAWQWAVTLDSSLKLPNLSSALSYSEVDTYNNVVTAYDGINDRRGASGRTYPTWFRFGSLSPSVPIQLNCSVINSKVPCQNQILDNDGVNVVRTTNYLVRDNSTGYSGTPAPNIAPVVSSVGGNILTQFPSANTVNLPWTLDWDFSSPTNPGFETRIIGPAGGPLINLEMILEFWYTV
jgi:hypothetical protein